MCRRDDFTLIAGWHESFRGTASLALSVLDGVLCDHAPAWLLAGHVFSKKELRVARALEPVHRHCDANE